MNDYHERFNLFIASFYYIVTTLTTVGYGDISPHTTLERIFGIFLMFLGTAIFSAAISATTNLLQSMDSRKAIYDEKMETLNDI